MEAKFCTRFKIRLASNGRERRVLADDVFDSRNGLIEFSLLIFDNIVINIRVLEPLFCVAHAFKEVGFAFLGISGADTAFKDIQRRADKDRWYIREESFDALDAFPICLPDTYTVFLVDHPVQLRGTYPVRCAIFVRGILDEGSFLDRRVECFLGDEIVWVAFRLAWAFIPGSRGDDAFQWELFPESFDEGIFSGSGWTGDDENVGRSHTVLEKKTSRFVYGMFSFWFRGQFSLPSPLHQS